MNSVDAMADAIFAAAQEYVGKAMKGVGERFAEFEARFAALPKPEKGEDGKSVEPAEVERMVEAAVGRIPRPKDGEPGKSVEAAEVVKLVAELVGKMPQPKPEAVDYGLVRTELKALVAELPPPKDGAPADPALLEAAIAEARKAAEGYARAAESAATAAEAMRTAEETYRAAAVSLKALARAPTSFFINAGGELVGINPEGEEKTLGRVCGKDGGAGEPGLDAFEIAVREGFRGTRPEWLDSLKGKPGTPGGITESSIELADDLRTIVCKHTLNDGTVVEKRLKVPTVIERGVYEYKRPYERADCVSRSGTYWIANKDTDEVPGEGSAWRMMFKSQMKR